jgi:hypothetical protein
MTTGRGISGPGKYNSYLIMNSINKAVLASDPNRIYDLVNPETCKPLLFTNQTSDVRITQMDRSNAWFISAAMIAERDFEAQGQGSLELGWKLVTEAPLDYLRLDGCGDEGKMKQMADVLARAPGFVSRV